MKRPKRLTVIAVLFILAGGLAAWEVVYDLFHDHLNLNFAVLMIPVGIGLLKGRSSSRGWAKFWISLFSLMAGGFLVFYPFYGDSYSVGWFDHELAGLSRHAVAIGFPIASLLLARWMWRIRSLHSVAQFFDDSQYPNAQKVDAQNP